MGKKALKSTPIRAWVREEQPREILLRSGAQSLAPAKLLAVILRTGRRGVNAEELSRALLNRFRSLRGIDSASARQIGAIKGIGRAKTAQLLAAFEIGKRLCRERAARRPRICGPRAAVRYVASWYGPYLMNEHNERACAILLDRQNSVLGTVELGRGTAGSVEVEVRRIAWEAVGAGAAGMILVHNHPGGGTGPSSEDLAQTRTVQEMCRALGMDLVDHVIVGRDREACFSFARAGLL